MKSCLFYFGLQYRASAVLSSGLPSGQLSRRIDLGCQLTRSKLASRKWLWEVKAAGKILAISPTHCRLVDSGLYHIPCICKGVEKGPDRNKNLIINVILILIYVSLSLHCYLL